jgi:hypothetical protein
MSTPSGPQASSKRPAWTPESGRRPLVGEVDENLIDMPTKQALLMLGVITTATLIMWAAGRAACNYHVPGDGLTAREVTFEERTRNPKGVAIEFAQALSGADFEVARRLVAPAAEGLVKAEEDCGECSAEKAARKNILSVADVLRATRDDTIVAVRTVGAPGGPVDRVLRIQRKVEEKVPWRIVGSLPGRTNLPELEGSAAPDAPPMRIQLPPTHPLPAQSPASPTAPAPAAPAPSAPSKP